MRIDKDVPPPITGTRDEIQRELDRLEQIRASQAAGTSKEEGLGQHTRD